MMPRRKRNCNCRICDYQQNAVDARIIIRHNLLYGSTDEIPKPVQVNFPTSSTSPVQIHLPTASTTIRVPPEACHGHERCTDESPVHVSFPTANTANIQAQPEACRDHERSTDEIPSPLQVHFPTTSTSPVQVHFPITSTAIPVPPEACYGHQRKSSETNDDTSSESSSDGEASVSDNDDTSDTDSGDCIQDKGWSCSYDSSIYSEGIAVQKVPNSNISVLQWLALNFNLFTSHPSMSKKAFSDHLKTQAIIHSASDLLQPIATSYSQARKLIDPYLVKKIVFHMCVNDCVAYRNEKKNLSVCPVCKSDKKKRFIYLPIGPRIARIYGEESLAKLVQAHSENRCSTDAEDLMWDIHDAPLWKEAYSEKGYFNGNKSGLSFALELDGVNPYHNIGVMYSMTPIMLTLLNLPRHIRNAFGNIMLVGIVPGNGRSEATHLDPYIEIMVDEMLYLTQCTLVDQYQKAPIDVKIKVLLFVLDYPGLSKVFNQQGSGGLSGCHWCFIRGKHCSHLSKVIYLSNRAYLAAADQIRKDSVNFSEKKEEFSLKPNTRSVDREKSFREAYDVSSVKVNAAIIATATGYKGMYALAQLPAHDRLEETNPDACHTIKDVVQNIMNLLTSRNINLNKIIAAEQAYGRLDLDKLKQSADLERVTAVETDDTDSIASFDHSIAKRPRATKSIPTKKSSNKKGPDNSVTLPYILTKEEISTADERAKNIRVPLGFGVKPAGFISKSGSLKSHDWKQIACHGILKYFLRGTLSHQCRETLFNLLDCISSMCSESQSMNDLLELDNKINIALALFERDFPLTLQNITTHILHHIVEGIRKYGPVYGTWMYVFERFNSWICKRALNMRYPEATVMETFIVYDWCQFLIATGRLPSELISLCSEDVTDEREESNLHMKCKPVILSKRELKSVHSVCSSCTQKCSITKSFSHIEMHPITRRTVKYSCSSRSSSLTRSCYVCFEASRGSPATKVLSGKFVVFGVIQYILKHLDLSVGDETNVACIETYQQACFDQESKLWYCSADTNTQKSYAHIGMLSCPLVTAEADGLLWILDCGKLPYIRTCLNYGEIV